MKPKNLDAAIKALVAEANANGASLQDINQLIKLLKQQAADDEARNQNIDVPPDTPKDAA
jgi:hypothetical protein